MKRFALFIFFVVATLSLPALAKKLTCGFRIAKMTLEFPSNPYWDTPFSAEILPILKQPYRYMSKGAQCYVFESEDGCYVVKFFRFDRPKNQVKIETLFNACKLAYDRLQEETGLVYLHLNRSQSNLPILRCKDAVGRSYQFPLDQYRFAIQKKAKPFRTVFEEAIDDPPLMKSRIDQFLYLLSMRTQKGVFNTDPTLSRNFGFLEDRAIEIDFGNYRSAAEYTPHQEIVRYTERLRRWLNIRAPQWVSYLDSRVKELE